MSLTALPTVAEEDSDSCLINAIQSADDDTTVAEIKATCETRAETTVQLLALAPIGRRTIQKHNFYGNTFEMAPHRPNYLLPFTYIDNPNQTPFTNVYGGGLRHSEIQFQISFKTTVFKGVLLGHGELVAGYTNRSFWQAYNGDISRPFRETNHEPELFITFESSTELLGLTNTENSLVFNHQSNGQSGDLSRSWNRVMLKTVWERDNFAFALRPWYRIPESEGYGPEDPSGDDNPDITDYLGHFDFHAAYSSSANHSFTLMLRNNLKSDNRGALELGWSFPFGAGLHGYLKYFNGYGESLIDYNSSTESIALGIEVNDW